MCAYLSELSSTKRTDLKLVGLGLSSTVVTIKNTNVVAKIPNRGSEREISIEKSIYERLQNHPNILRYHGQIPTEHAVLSNALIFDYHRNGNLQECLNLQHPRRKKWPLQVVSALSFVHSRDIVHGDIGLHNFLLTDGGDLVLCDFAGSGKDGEPPLVSAGVRYTNPSLTSLDPSKEDDIFALGTVLYELSIGEPLFKGQDNAEIRSRFRQKHFPDLSPIELPLREVIRNCWQQQDYTAFDAVQELNNPEPEHCVRWWNTILAVLILAHWGHQLFEKRNR